jgi:hypothetical protein
VVILAPRPLAFVARVGITVRHYMIQPLAELYGDRMAALKVS